MRGCNFSDIFDDSLECTILPSKLDFQLKYPPWWFQEGNPKHRRPTSALCFLSKTTPISYVTLQENPVVDRTFL